MQIVKEYPANTFSWLDLATTDAAAAKKFYTSLFGWETVDMPMGPDSFYTMLTLSGQNVAGLQQGDPAGSSYWTSYASVTDVDAATKKAQGLGGQILAEPFDVLDAGRMSVLQDPTGATFALWQTKTHIGASLVNIPGALCWNELNTHNLTAAESFYTELFDWTSSSMDMGSAPYIVLMNGSRAAGGMMTMPKEAGNAPSFWLVYIAVDDFDTSAANIEALGGKLLTAPINGSAGRFAVAQDPQGAVFAIIKMINADPPPGY
jgi:predicted enzyme related to lactoylglutathione lyase